MDILWVTKYTSNVKRQPKSVLKIKTNKYDHHHKPHGGGGLSAPPPHKTNIVLSEHFMRAHAFNQQLVYCGHYVQNLIDSLIVLSTNSNVWMILMAIW